MMIKIAHKAEAETLKDLPVEVMAKVLEIATILDDSYGKDRGEKDLGGYILIAEDKEDIVSINKLIDFNYTLPEYVDSSKQKLPVSVTTSGEEQVFSKRDKKYQGSDFQSSPSTSEVLTYFANYVEQKT